MGSLVFYENGDFWVAKEKDKGYAVFKTGITCSTRVATIGYDGDEGLQRAKVECDRRAAAATTTNEKVR